MWIVYSAALETDDDGVNDGDDDGDDIEDIEPESETETKTVASGKLKNGACL